MIVALATGMGMAEHIRSEPEDILRHGFGERPLFEALIAERAGVAVGLSLYFSSFSSWNGKRGVYLATLQGEFEVALRSERSAAEYQRTLRSGLEEVERLAAMCDSMLLVTRTAAGTLRAHLAPTDITDVARKVLDEARRQLDAKGATAMEDLRYANGAIPMDGRLIERMLRNLVDNAVRFTPAGGALAVGTLGADMATISAPPQPLAAEPVGAGLVAAEWAIQPDVSPRAVDLSLPPAPHRAALAGWHDPQTSYNAAEWPDWDALTGSASAPVGADHRYQ